MSTIPEPIFKKKLSKTSWKKIYAREYGVSYSEGAIVCLSSRFRYHIPKTTQDDIVIPEGNNTAFYIDRGAWVELVESLNNKYTTHTKKLKEYEKGFIQDGEKYLETAKKIYKLNLKNLTNRQLREIYGDYQEKLLRYSVYAWTSFILNNYIAEKATKIIDKYIQRNNRENEKQDIYNSLFHPLSRAAVLKLQDEVQKHRKLNSQIFNRLYEKYKWLSCLDIHNDPLTKEEFSQHVKSLHKEPLRRVIPFKKIADNLKISTPDLDYLLMAQRFVYIKDARDDYRRQSVYFALPFFEEIGRRMGFVRRDVSFLQQVEVIGFLEGKIKISKAIIAQRKKGFVLYLDKKKKFICLVGDDMKRALKLFKLLPEEEKFKELVGTVASGGKVTGRVIIVRGVKDLSKVKKGNILVAPSTHPDYVPAMRRAAAIVTDEGGITSHAAIVSREFGIPCIVGTKNATKFLKDGDRIEVDGIEGLVKNL